MNLSVPEVKLRNPPIGIPTDVLNNFTRFTRRQKKILQTIKNNFIF